MYNHKEIEKKWQKKWQESGIYKTGEDKSRPKYYVLDMFPYPSGAGLHVGHPKGYIATDVVARFKMMNGFNVLHPMGWDAFGLPAENYALKTKTHPRIATEKNVQRFKEQLEILGLTYDWEREINTTDPEYYKWTQWIFLQMFKHGLAYESYAPINWCPDCKTGLANEDLEDGKCERCGSEIEQKPLRQWVLKITDYAEKLLDGLKTLDWEKSIIQMQENWIGRSEGAIVKFQITNNKSQINSKLQNQKSNVVIVHGSNDTEKESKEGESENLRHWQPWLKKELEKEGFDVSNQLYPTDWIPEYEEYKKVFEQNKIDEHTILVGHSNGCAFLLRWLMENKKKINKLILIAPAILYTDQNEVLKKFKNFEFNNTLNNYLKELVVYYSDDDVVENIIKSAKIVNKKLGGKLFNLIDRGHFTSGDIGSDKFPELLAEILDQKSIEVFTTRPDTLFGATYCVLSPEHELVNQLETEIENIDEVKNYQDQAKKKTQLERTDLNKEKTGVELKGVKAINPVNNEELPIYIADYVLTGYGTGAIMAVPAHDERDFEFAKKFNLPIKNVVIPVFGTKHPEAEFRKTVSAIVQRKSDGKFLCLKWKKKDWISQSVGGIEEGETPEQAAEREVLEETGYKTRVIKQLGSVIESFFYADHKKVWRHRLDTPMLMELLDEQPQKISPTEAETHEVMWLTKEEILKQVTHEHNKITFLRYFEGEKAFSEEGRLIDSGEFTGLMSKEAKEKIINWLEEKKVGSRKINYKLQDWVFSRQRYWGEPIPVIHCEKCGIVAVPEDQLPITLPEVKNYEPTGTGESPLANIAEWVNTTCPTCGGPAKRETNTMPQWAGSCWYYLRYIDPKNNDKMVDPAKEKYWMTPAHRSLGEGGVDLYVGGAEHATRHLIYARFWHRFLYDIKAVSTPEPFTKLQHVGLIMGEDGRKMSKRWGNVVNPDDIVAEYGADALRVYEMFMGPFDNAIAWNTQSLVGSRRFLERVEKLFDKKTIKQENNKAKNQESKKSKDHEAVNRFPSSQVARGHSLWRRSEGLGEVPPLNSKIESLIHKTIKKVTSDIQELKFNTAISSMMILINEMEKQEEIAAEDYQVLLQILAPFAPHLTEELWEKLGNTNSIFTQPWPTYDEELTKDSEVELVVQINGKVRDKILIPSGLTETEMKEKVLASEKIKNYLASQEVKKIIFIKGKLVSIVI